MRKIVTNLPTYNYTILYTAKCNIIHKRIYTDDVIIREYITLLNDTMSRGTTSQKTLNPKNYKKNFIKKDYFYTTSLKYVIFLL